jgi:phage shock protein E
MNAQELQNYLIPVAIVLFFGWRFFKFKKIKGLIPDYIKQGAVIVDVRSAGEYSQGSSPLSINIPLTEISRRASELDKNKPIILCCASGARSGAAVGILKSLGFKNIVNAGPWSNTLNHE